MVTNEDPMDGARMVYVELATGTRIMVAQAQDVEGAQKVVQGWVQRLEQASAVDVYKAPTGLAAFRYTAVVAVGTFAAKHRPNDPRWITSEAWKVPDIDDSGSRGTGGRRVHVPD